jgi:hypothetical protein
VILRFHTYEEAAIYAGVMQSEGYFAEILDECSGFLYGSFAAGGFRVIATDEPVADMDDPPAPGPLENAILNFFRLLVNAFVALGLTLGISAFCQTADSFMVTALLGVVAAMAGWLGICCLMGPLMLPFTRILRDENSALGSLIKGSIAALYAAQYLCLIGCVVYQILTWLVAF